MAQIAACNFTGDNFTNLETAYTDWIKNLAQCQIYSNMGYDSGGGVAGYYYNCTPSSADYSVEADIYYFDYGANSEFGVTARYKTDYSEFYLARYKFTASDTAAVELLSYSNPNWSTIGSGTNLTVAQGNAYTIKLVCNGDQIELWKHGDSSATYTVHPNTTVTATNKPGFWCNGDDWLIDNWHADDLEAGGETREFAPLPTGASATSSGIATVIRPVAPVAAGSSSAATVIGQVLRVVSVSASGVSSTSDGITQAIRPLSVLPTGASATGTAIAAVLRQLVESVAASSATSEITVIVTGLIEFPASVTAASVTSAVYELILREILLSLSAVSSVSEITLDVAAAAAQEQEGFRFRNDDGTEVTATWRAVQDTDISLQSGVNFRLRFVINATGDPAASQYQVEYKKSTDADWSKVV